MIDPPFSPDISIRLDILVPDADPRDLADLKREMANALKDLARAKLSSLGEGSDWSVRVVPSGPSPQPALPEPSPGPSAP